MPRIYVEKGTRTREIDEDAMKSAMREVLDKTLSIRKSAQKYGVKPTTLQSRLTKIHKTAAAKKEDNIPVRVFSSKFTSNQVFTTEEETLLNKYITNCSKMHYGLTIVLVRKLAYEFAKANQLRYPLTWDLNRMAEKEWLDSFRRRNVNLSLRKPKNTSAARFYGFNRTAVSDFYENLKKVLIKYKLTADRIYNFDESGISTVLSTPKVLAEKNQKQIASGNTIPPLFIFPKVHFKDHFMAGAPEGSLGVANKSGWINSGIFLEVLKHIQKKTSCSKDNPILILVDNHESHVTIEAVDYARGSPAGPDVNVQQIIPEKINNTQQDQPPISAPAPTSLLSQPLDSPSTSAVGLMTPEIIRPYPKVDRNALKKSKKGKLPGKSRIYTDTPEKNRLEEIEKAKETRAREKTKS
ncbi:hypothetical protein JTB14_008992 [Gonioctena quinquepunctata]|nr:hypothetical protein JTB14_008992 [Gonioctena quinquepunctata]